MHRFCSFFLVMGALAGPLNGLAQDVAAQAALLAERREMDERYHRLKGDVADLTEALTTQGRKITALTAEINRLREENSALSGKIAAGVSRDDLRKLAEKMQEMETKRESDKKLILEEIQRLAKIVTSTPAPVIKPAAPSKSAPIDATQDFYPYKIQKGDTLSEIIKVYNADLKERGLPPVTLDQVKKANPKINPERLPAGREILLPVPSK